jgi:hypothetical protein
MMERRFGINGMWTFGGTPWPRGAVALVAALARADPDEYNRERAAELLDDHGYPGHPFPGNRSRPSRMARSQHRKAPTFIRAVLRQTRERHLQQVVEASFVCGPDSVVPRDVVRERDTDPGVSAVLVEHQPRFGSRRLERAVDGDQIVHDELADRCSPLPLCSQPFGKATRRAVTRRRRSARSDPVSWRCESRVRLRKRQAGWRRRSRRLRRATGDTGPRIRRSRC